MTRLYTSAYGLTIEQYRALEADGLVTRPITDDELGCDPTRRHANAVASAAITEAENAVPWEVDPELPRLGGLRRRASVERRRRWERRRGGTSTGGDAA